MQKTKSEDKKATMISMKICTKYEEEEEVEISKIFG